MGDWAARVLCPLGPYPALRVADVPYGVLPAVDMSAWASRPNDPPWEHTVLSTLRIVVAAWAEARRAGGTAAGAAVDGLLEIIGRVPTARAPGSRLFLPLDLIALLRAVAFGKTRATWSTSGRRRAKRCSSISPTPLRRYQAFGYVQPAVRGREGVRDVLRRYLQMSWEELAFGHEAADRAPFLVRLLRHSLLLTQAEVSRLDPDHWPAWTPPYLLPPDRAPEQFAADAAHGGRVDQLPDYAQQKLDEQYPPDPQAADDRRASSATCDRRFAGSPAWTPTCSRADARHCGRGGAGHIEPPHRPVDHGCRNPPPSPTDRPRRAAPPGRVRLGRRPLARHRPDTADQRRPAPRAGAGAGARGRGAPRPCGTRSRRALADHRPVRLCAARGEARSGRPARHPPERGDRPRGRAARRRPGRRPHPAPQVSAAARAGRAPRLRRAARPRRRSGRRPGGGRAARRPPPRPRHVRRPARRRCRPRRRLRPGGPAQESMEAAAGLGAPPSSGCSAPSGRAYPCGPRSWSPARCPMATRNQLSPRPIQPSPRC